MAGGGEDKENSSDAFATGARKGEKASAEERSAQVGLHLTGQLLSLHRSSLGILVMRVSLFLPTPGSGVDPHLYLKPSTCNPEPQPPSPTPLSLLLGCGNINPQNREALNTLACLLKQINRLASDLAAA